MECVTLINLSMTSQPTQQQHDPLCIKAQLCLSLGVWLSRSYPCALSFREPCWSLMKCVSCFI